MATATLWRRDGKIVVNSSGRLILCDHCPCTSCAGCTEKDHYSWDCLSVNISYGGVRGDFIFRTRSGPTCVNGSFETVFSNPIACSANPPAVPSNTTATLRICDGYAGTCTLSLEGAHANSWGQPHTCNCSSSSSSSSSSGSGSPCSNPPTVTGSWYEAVWSATYTTCWWAETGGNPVQFVFQNCSQSGGVTTFEYLLLVDNTDAGNVRIIYRSSSQTPEIDYVSAAMPVVTLAGLDSLDCFGDSYCVVATIARLEPNI